MSEREAFYSVGRLERAVAVLVGDDGVGLDVLKKTLPVKVREGVVLRVRLDAAGNPDWSSATIDDAERERRLQEARERLERLRGTDPGGDVVLQRAPGEDHVLLHDLVQTSRSVAATSGRLAKIDLVAALLKRAGPDEIEIAIAFLSGSLRQGRIGIGYATLQAAQPEQAAAAPTLELAAVDAALQRLATTTGKGSTQMKQRLLGELFARGTADEREFLLRLLMGELRQGALEGLVTEAVARAAGLEAGAVRRATMLAADLGRVAHAALTRGAAGLTSFRVELFRPLQPMLAQAAEDVGDALTRLGERQAAFEYKLDGARIQVHKARDEEGAFFERAIAAGQEGLMAKALDARYDAGARGGAWLKLKPAHTLDLVVLAAEWGHGRRRGRLSNLHLGARDGGGFAMLGKTFKGMTDEMLEWQTAKLLELETRHDGHVVHVRPELVVEVAFNGIQASPTYPGRPAPAGSPSAWAA